MNYNPINTNIDQLDLNDEPLTGRAKELITCYADLLSIRHGIACAFTKRTLSDPHGAECYVFVSIFKALHDAVDAVWSDRALDNVAALAFDIDPYSGGNLTRQKVALERLRDALEGHAAATHIGDAIAMLNSIIDDEEGWSFAPDGCRDLSFRTGTSGQ